MMTALDRYRALYADPTAVPAETWRAMASELAFGAECRADARPDEYREYDEAAQDCEAWARAIDADAACTFGTSIARAAVLAAPVPMVPPVARDDQRLAWSRVSMVCACQIPPTWAPQCLADAARAADRVIADCA